MSNVMTAAALVDKAVDIAKNYKTLYVMGCFGAPLTGANVTRYCTNHAYNQAADRTAMIKAAANQSPPVYGYDCVNLIKAILWGWSGDASKTYGGAAYASNGVPDVSADGMIAKCTNVSTTGWTSMVPGEVVWLTGHIGIYIGDGLAVECSPKWQNKVQITAVGNIGSKSGYNTRTWSKHGKLPYVDYTAVSAAQTTPSAPAAPTAPAASPITTIIEEGEIDMTKEEVTELIDEKITAAMSLTGTGDNPASWAKTATEWAKAQGIFSGDDNGNYGWDKPVTREQLAIVLYRSLCSTGTGDKPAAWAKEGCDWAKAQEIFQGDGAGNYGWQQPVTREQLANILLRVL